MSKIKNKLVEILEGYKVYGWADWNYDLQKDCIWINEDTAEEIANIIIKELNLKK